MWWPSYSIIFHYLKKVFALLELYVVRLIPTYLISWKSVLLNTAPLCPPYSTIFSYQKKCPPYCTTMVSALFHQLSALFQLIFSLKIMSALIQQSEKKCPPYSGSHQKSVHLIPTLWSPPYYNIFQYSKSVRLIPEICPPYYRS